MGLDTTHSAWSGSCSRFHQWRRYIADLNGINLDQMDGFGGDKEFDLKDDLTPLLSHSDCDGILTPEECERIARALTNMLERGIDEDFIEKTETFRDGGLLAVSKNENIEFR